MRTLRYREAHSSFKRQNLPPHPGPGSRTWALKHHVLLLLFDVWILSVGRIYMWFWAVSSVPRYQEHLGPSTLTQMLISRSYTLGTHEIKDETPENKNDYYAFPFSGQASSYCYYQIWVCMAMGRGRTRMDSLRCCTETALLSCCEYLLLWTSFEMSHYLLPGPI